MRIAAGDEGNGMIQVIWLFARKSLFYSPNPIMVDLMTRRKRLTAVLMAGALSFFASLLSAQSDQSAYPPISQREFVGGSVKVKVTGTLTMDQEIQINTKASIGGGDMTWLQYGASGSAEGDVLITFTQTGEVGIMVGRNKITSTTGITPGEKPQCTGKVDVTAKLIAGHYTCKGSTSYDPKTFKMGKVDIDVEFTGKS